MSLISRAYVAGAVCFAFAFHSAGQLLAQAEDILHYHASQQFLLRVPEQPQLQSTVEVSETELLVTDTMGKMTKYIRTPILDSRDHCFRAYSCSRLRQAIRWPVSGGGSMYIKRSTMPWAESRMQVYPIQNPLLDFQPDQGFMDYGSAFSESATGASATTWPVIAAPSAQPDQQWPAFSEGTDGSIGLPQYQDYSPEPYPIYEDPYEVGYDFYLPQPVVAPQPRFIGSQVIRGKRQPPVRVTFRNSGPDDLVVTLRDRWNERVRPTEFLLPPGNEHETTLQPRMADQIEKSYLIPDGTGWSSHKELVQLTDHPQFTVAAYRKVVRYEVINRVAGKDDAQNNFVRRAPVCVGTFPLPPGDELIEGRRFDVYELTSSKSDDKASSAIYD